ncbi:FG-GAP repeat domain-containing protein [Alienimonas californiensis]|uniref:FG-GAP repeat protein n=1 Tax=Alienimonas californiensis TaxID=2527989 RepID=A0A517PAS0_9PLAN|nr:VCBS repeat-containing protein [Alienimonas californiensis]QDT16468.1 FG-GAP repeat protein [Alienimonas californiensis]
MPRPAPSLLPGSLAVAAPLAVAVLLAVGALPARAQDDAAPLSVHYGFGELDILKVEDRSELLRTADLNGDGLTDLLLSDDSNSRLDLFLQRNQSEAAEAGKEEGADAADVNALPDSARYEHVKLSVDRAVLGLATGDFTGDGRTDIAYVGDPDRLILVVAPEGDTPGSSDWTATAELDRRERRLPDLQSSSGLLAAGDLTGDGRPDLVALGQRVTYLLPGSASGTLEAAIEIRNTSDDLSLAQIADLDGDGLADLSYTALVGDDRVFAARLQEPAPRPRGEAADDVKEEVRNALGPELRFDLKDPRSVTLGEAFPDEPGVEVLAITGATGRLTIRKVRRPKLSDAADGAAEENLAGRKLTQYGFGGRGDRDFAVGDLDGDGLADVVVSDPAGARVILFRQTAAGGLDLGTAYPSLAGISQVRIGDADGDGSGDLFVLSKTEETLGRSVWEDDRLTFPVPVTGVENPVAFALIQPQGANRAGAFAVTRNDRRDYSLGLVGAPEKSIKLDISSDPDRLEVADLDGNGAGDLVLFPGRGKELLAFGIGGDGKPIPMKSEGLGPGETTPGAFFAGFLPPEPEAGDGGENGEPAAPQPDVPTILVARDNLARDLTARAGRTGVTPGSPEAEAGAGNPTLRWSVRDQFNAGEAAAKIAGAVTLDVDDEPGNEVILIDSGVDKLRIYKRDGSQFAAAGEIETGALDYIDAAVADLDGDARDDLLLFGQGRFAVLYAGRTDPELTELANYETDLDRTFLADSFVGDLNGDDKPDVAVLDVRSHYVEILRPTDSDVERALYWKLFEEKNFDGEGGGGLQPREGAIADVTGDGRNDLILLIHDRVLIYPQDDGVGPEEEKSEVGVGTE